MDLSSSTKIYIQLLDGSTVGIPVYAKQVDDFIFELLEDKEFTDYVDPLYIHEFYPGDIVEVAHQKSSEGKPILIAIRLIKAGNWKDRKLNEFKYKAALEFLKFNKETAAVFREEIKRVEEEILNGQIYYQGIIEAVNCLNKLL